MTGNRALLTNFVEKFLEMVCFGNNDFAVIPSYGDVVIVSQVDEASKKDLEVLFQDFYDEYFDSSKVMKSSTTNVETSINEEVFHEVFESFQGESSLSSLNDDVQQCPKEAGCSVSTAVGAVLKTKSGLGGMNVPVYGGGTA
nr:hypothetical protein [Tanacetum cinerariifolium]